MSTITKADALLAIDAAMGALASARAMLDSMGDDPAVAVGGCQHPRTASSFSGVMCRDCGETLGAPPEQPEPQISTIQEEV